MYRKKKKVTICHAAVIAQRDFCLFAISNRSAPLQLMESQVSVLQWSAHVLGQQQPAAVF